MTGRRIVNVSHILKQLENIASHSKVCTMGRYKFQREVVSGFYCKWIYYCDNCEKEVAVTSEPDICKEECNDAMVWGALTIGVGYAQMQELCGLMDIPLMGQPKFRSHERKIGKVN